MHTAGLFWLWQLTDTAVSDQNDFEQIVVLLLRCTHSHATTKRSDTRLVDNDKIVTDELEWEKATC